MPLPRPRHYNLDKFEWSRSRPVRAIVGKKLSELRLPMHRLAPFS